ncbi:hypothetical protein LTR37_006394 [Vermiconidia calcicola]|uniref:Uncharacterized protein n=1 Tax=Vermiconidia calcicola TaxID=1690605 RepID=A0ACC3NGA8_9PEZI|nr:hypothetical protein LTR37_006394 [Vermiconidia calcicola]
MPSLLRNLMVLLVRTAQARRASSYELVNDPILCRYRGQSILDLKASLPEAVLEPYGIALSGIMLMMGIEILNPVFGQTWSYHLEAARRIIEIRGGMSTSFFGMPWSQNLLINYMWIDIMSCTTCNAPSLNTDTTQAQPDYIPLLVLRQQEVLENGHACPLPILEAIVRITILRLLCRTSKKPLRKSLLLEQSSPARPFNSIMRDLEIFEPATWAVKVCGYGRIHPVKADECPSTAAKEAWTHLAYCHKYAALLYLLLSVRDPYMVEDQDRVRSIQQLLSVHVTQIMTVANSDPDGPIETQCWKFSLWPVFVSTYAHICWCSSSSDEVETEVAQFERTVAQVGVKSLNGMARSLHTIAASRISKMPDRWQWDDGFEGRSVFGPH